MQQTRLPLAIILTLWVILLSPLQAKGEQEFDMQSFLGFKLVDPREQLRDNPKTLFQTNLPYDARVAIPVDGVIVHRHGHGPEDIASTLNSWQAKGYLPQRMFFADSDAGWVYTKGTHDGKLHLEDIELDRQGRQVLCADVRPYMLPTRGWLDYLKTQVRYAIDGGARAIYPEEPLAHNFTGYEASFRPLYEEEYGEPWQGGHQSPDAFYKTCRLKNQLYCDLEQQLQEYSAQYAQARGAKVDFLIPIHSLYSNLSAALVAPLGTSLSLRGHSGYIGQIWTGPVLWTLANFSDQETTFFNGAYVLYDYFVNLVDRSPRRLYLLTDPVEDHPGRTWEDYEKWYKECVVAELLFTRVNTYEVMPWPDRIFLPGYSTGGGTPAPASYRTMILSVITALQDMPAAEGGLEGGTPGVGMLIGDTAMWQHRPGKVQDPHLSLLIPLLKQGIPVSSVPIERVAEREYLSQFQLLLLSYDAWKPETEIYHEQLIEWVERGGVLIVFDGRDAFDAIDAFWTRQGFANPQSHLFDRMGVDRGMLRDQGDLKDFHQPVGKGHLIVRKASPETFARDAARRENYMRFVRACAAKYLGKELEEPEFLCAKRGDFLVCHTFDVKKQIEGAFVDLFSPELEIARKVELEMNSSALLLDVERLLQSRKPQMLYSTYRLIGKREGRDVTTFFVQGPAGSEGRARVYTAGKALERIEARTSEGVASPFEVVPGDAHTLLIRFPYQAEGVGFKIHWQ